MAGNEEYDEEMEAERELADSAMWKVIQKNTFTRWANEHLKQSKLQIVDMEKDFADGLKLIALIEALSGKKFAKFNKRPSFRTQKFENVTMSLKFLEEKEGIKLVNIDSSDIVDQKLKLIMGLVWTLILHYSITMPTWEDEGGFGKDQTPKQRLLAWIQNKIPEKNINNFTSDWNDGTAIAALVDAVAPGLFPDWPNLVPANKVQNAKDAMDLAEKFLDVPQVIKPDEMCNPKVDELSMMTYLSRFPSAKIKSGAPVQQKPNAQRIRAYGPGIEPQGNVVGAPARFIVETANAGKGDLEVIVLDPKGKQEKVELLPNNDRTQSYNCVYTPSTDGPYTVSIKFAGQPSTKQPYLVNVAPKAKAGDPSKVIAQGPGVEKSGVLVNRKTYFDVITKGAGVGVVDVGVFDPQGKPLKATVTKKSDDVWYVEYTAEVPGLHSVNVNFAGLPIPKSPYPVGVGGEGGPPVDASRLPGKPLACGPRDAAANSLATPLKAAPGSTAPVAEQPQQQLKPMPGKPLTPGEVQEAQAPGQGPAPAAKPGVPPAQIPIDAKKCWASGRGIQPKGVRLGDVADFKIHTENAGNAEPRAMVMGPGGTPVQTTLKKLDDDTYEAVYKPTKPGLHIVNVTFAGQQIPKSPFKVDIGPLKTSKVVAFGPGLESGVVNQPAKFTVQPNGEGPIGFKIEGPSQAKIDVTKNPQQTEMYVSYLPTSPGEYAVRILSNNDDIPKSPYIVDIRPVGEVPLAPKAAPGQAAATPVDSSKVTAYGPGLEKEGNMVNKWAEFTVDATKAGPAPLVVTVTDAENKNVDVKVVDNKNLTFSCKYLPLKAVRHTVTIIYSGKQVPKSPFLVNVKDLGVGAGKVKVYGPAIEKPVQAKILTYFIIDCKEAGPGEPKVTLTNDKGQPLNFQLKDLRDRTYRVEFTAMVSGVYTSHVTFSAQPVPKSPFTINVLGGPDASKVKVYGPALEGPINVNELSYFIVDCKEAGPGEPRVVLIGEKGGSVQTKMVDQNDRTYKIEFTAPVAGLYNANVQFASSPVPKSPFRITAQAAVNIRQVFVKDLPEFVPVNKEVTFEVVTAGAGPGKVKVVITSPTGKSVPVRLDEKPGVATTSKFIPTEPGPYKVEVFFAEQPVAKSPFKVTAEAANPFNVKVYGPAVEKPVFVNEVTYFIVDYKEAGPGEPQVKLVDEKGVPIPFNALDQKDKTHRIEFTPVTPGTSTATVTFAGQSVPKSPYKITVQVRTDISKVKVYGPALERPVPIRQTTYFVIDCKEAGPGIPDFNLATEDGRPVQPKFIDNKDGTFTVEFIPESFSPIIAYVNFLGQPAPKSPYKVIIFVDVSKVKVYGPAVEGPVASKVPTHFVVDCKEVGPGEPKVSLVDDNGVKVPFTLNDNKDGTFKVDFIPESVPLTANVLFADQPVPKSPFKINVLGGLSNPSKVKLSGPAFEGPVAPKEPTYFNVDCKEAGPGEPKVTLTDENKAPVPFNVKDNKDGTYTTELTPVSNVPITAEVTFANQPVPQSPFKIVISLASKVKVYGPAVEHPVAPKLPTYFVVDCKEAGPGQPTVLLVDENGTPKPFQQYDNKDGTFKVEFVPETPSPLLAQVSFANEPVPKSPFLIKVVGGPVNPSAVRVYGPAVEEPVFEKVPTYFVVDCKEAGPGEPVVDLKSEDGTPIKPTVVDNKDQTFKVDFVPVGLKPIFAQVLFANQPVPKSPFKIDVRPGTVDASKVKLSGPAVEGPVKSNLPTFFNIDAKEAGPAKPEVTLATEDNKPVKAHVVDNKDGTYKVDFVPREVKPIIAQVKLANQHVPKSPFKVTVEPGPVVEPSKVKVYGPATEGPVKSSQPTYFVVDAKEAGPGEPEITLATEDGTPVKPHVTDNKDKTFKAEFVPVAVQPITAQVKFADEQVPKSPFKIPVEPGVTDASKVKLSGPAVEGPVKAEEPTHFVVDAKEAGPGKPEVKLVADNGAPVPAKVKDNHDGTYVVEFVPEAVVPITADVKYADKPVPKSPLKISVEPATGRKPDASKVKLLGPAVEGPVKCCEPTYFVVDAKEAGPGHPEITLTFESGTPLKPTVTDNKDGTYKVDFVPNLVQPITARVLFAGQHVPKSPLKIPVEKTTQCDSSKVHLYGPATEGPVKANQPTYFVIDAKEAGPGHPEVILSPEDGSLIKPTLTDNHDGTYKAEFVPVVVKPITAQVKYAGCQVPKSPFKIPVEPGVGDASKVKLSGPAVEGPVKSQEPTYFVVDAKEAGPGQPVVALTADNGSPVPAKVADNNDGTFVATFTPEAVVPITADVKFAGQEVPKSPFKIPVEPGTGKQPEPSKVKLYGPAVEGPVKSNEPTYFVIDAKEAGPGQPEVALFPENAAPLKATVTDNKDGTFKVDFVPLAPRPIVGQVKFAEKPVPKSPFKIQVEPTKPTDASKVKVFGPAVEGPVKSNQPTYFVVDAKEAGPGFPEVALTVDDGSLVKPKITDNHDGTYKAEFVPVVVKPITAQVKYAGCQVPKSPFKIPVEPGVNDASKVKLSGPAVEGPVKAQEPTYFVVDAKEAGPEKPEVKLTAANGAPVPVKVKDNHDGTYIADFVPEAVLPITAEVKYVGQQVPKSPLQIPVEPGTGKKPDASKVKLYGPAVEGPVKSNKPTYFVVDAKEAGPGGVPEVTLLPESGAPLKPTVTDNKDGTFKADFVPVHVHPITAHVKFADKEVPQSPFKIPVEPLDESDASKVKLYGPATEGPVKSNQPTYFVVDAKEAGPGYPEVVIAFDDGSLVTPTVTDNKDGTYTIEFVPVAVKPLTVQVKYAGKQVPKSPFKVTVLAGGVNPSKVKLSGPAVEGPVKSQEPTYFVVDAKEAGPDQPEVKLTPQNGAPLPVQLIDNHDGTYVADFVPEAVVPITAEVKYAGQQVPKSPLQIHVEPGTGKKPDASKVKLYGPAVEGPVKSNKPTYFVIDAKEAGPGGHPVVELNVEGGTPLKPTVTDNKDGTFKADFVPLIPQPIIGQVKFAGQQVPKSPFKIPVELTPGGDATKVKLSGPAVEGPVKSNQPTFFLVDAKEAGPGYPEVVLTTDSGTPVKPNVTEVANSVYKVDFVPTAVQPITGQVKFAGQQVPKSPFRVPVEPGTGPDVSKVKVYGPAVERPVKSQEPTYFVVDTKESGPGVVDVVLKDDDNKESKPAIQDNQDGTFKVDFVPDKPLEATVLLNNQPVPSSPFKISVQPLPFDITSEPQHFESFPVSPEEAASNPHFQPPQDTRPGQEPDVTKVKVYGPALESPVSSGLPTHFVVDTRESGPGSVNINFTCEGNVTISPQIIDNKDGTYRTEFTPEGTGTLTANVEFDGKPVPKNPFHVKVVGSGGAENVKVYGPAVEFQVTPNVPTHFVVDCKEAGPDKPHVELVTDSGKNIEPLVSDDLAGTYQVEFAPPNEPLTAKILYAGQPVPKSPVRIEPLPEALSSVPDVPSSFQFVPLAQETPAFQPSPQQGHPDVSKVRAYGPALEQPVEVAKPTHFVVDSRDAGPVPPPVVNVVKPDGSPVPVQKTDNKDGTYKVDFTPQDTGVVLSHVSVAGQPVPGSPFKTTVQPQTTTPAKVSDVPKALIVGKPEPINIQLAGPKPGPATVELVGPHGNVLSSPVYDKPDGYLGQVTAVEPGPHKIVVKVANVPVEGSPFNVEAAPASLTFSPADVVDASKVKVYGSGLHGGTTNTPCDFTIDTSAAGPGNLGLTIDGPTEAKIECFDKGNGVFDVRYLPNEPGEYTINITFDDKPVPHSPFKAQINPEILVDVSRVRTYGPGVEPQGVYLDSVTEFTVDTATVQPKGVGNVKVILTNPSGTLTEAIVKKNDDDTYTCLYTPFEEGPTKIDVTYDGLRVPGSPFSTNVTPGCDPSKVKVYGPGIERGEPNKPQKFVINTRGAGVGGVGLSVVGPTEPQVDCVDNQDGTLSVEYLPETPGDYEIGVTFADQPVPGSPFIVPIGEPVKPFFPDRVKCFGPGLNPQGVKQGQKAIFSVVTNQAGEAPLEVVVNDLNAGTRLPARINKNPSGTYDVEYEPHNEGPIRIDVLYGGRPVPGSPFNTVSKPTTDLTKVVLTGDGVRPQVPASIPVNFTVDTRSAAPTPLPVDVEVKTPQGKVVKPTVTPVAPGVTQVSYTPEDAGPHQVHVKVADQEVPNSPIRVTAVPTGNPEKVLLPDNIPPSVAPHQTFSFTVQKPSTAGLGNVSCKVTKAGQPGFPATEIPVTVQDNHDGTVLISYPVPQEGVLVVETKFGGVLVPRGRFTQKVGKPGEPTLTPLIPTKVSVGEMSPQTPQSPVTPFSPTAPLRPVEVSSIPVGPDMSQVTAVVIKPSGENVPVQVVETEKGTIRVNYVPTETGLHLLKVLYAGQPVPGDPFTFYVHAPVPGQVTAFGPGLVSGAVNQPCVFTVVTKNAGKGGLSLAIEGPSKAEIKCRDNKDGSATITYTPTSPGEYKIVVKHAGQPIPGAPFVAKITGEDRSIFTRTVTTTEQSTITRQSHVTVGSTRHISIQVTESDLGNLSALIRSPSGVEEPCGLKRQPSGQLGISFTPKESGEHLVIVFRNGQPIPGSPFRVFIQAAEVGDANRVKIYGENLTQGQASEVNSFTINTKEAGVAGLSISVQGPGKVDIKCTENEDGTTKVTYRPTEPGVYHVTIKYGDKPVPGSPFTINVGGVPSGRVKERIVRQQQAATMTSVGTTCELNITMPGINISEIEGCVTSPSGQIERCQIVDLGNNKFRISFSPKESGIHYVSLKHKGLHIPGSPFQFTVGPIVGGGPEKVRAIGPGLVRGEANHPCHFTVITREAGAGSLSLGVEGPSKAVIDFQDKKDGTSDVNYICSEPGEYLVSVKFNNQHIPDSPFKVYISSTGGEIHKLHVQNLQQYGLPVNTQTQFLVEFNGAQGKLDAKVVAPSGQESEATVQEIRPGHFSIVFLPKESGVHYVHLLLNGNHIPGSPYPVQVGLVNADPSRVRAYGEGLHHGQSGKPCKFVVNTTDSGPGALSVGISGPSKVELQTREVEEGYEFTYTPLAPGPYLITIKYAGNTHIPGSPFKAQIEGVGTPAAFTEQSRVVVETVTKTTTSSITSHQGELICDVSKVTASGPGLSQTTTNQDSTFNVDGSQAGYNVLHVGVAGPHIPVDKVFVNHLGDLRYSVRYQVSQPGRYLIYVKWGEQHIPGSPFTVIAK